MATIDVGDRIWFQVPTPAGRIDVAIPAEDMAPIDAWLAADKIRAVIRAMFLVDEPKPSIIPREVST
jgi:hypothetical protein